MSGAFSFVMSSIDVAMFSRQLHTSQARFEPFTLLIMGMAKHSAAQPGLTPRK